MNVFITGAGGYIGGSVAVALMAQGHRVRGLTRQPASAAQLASLGIDPVIGMLDDAELLVQEARRCDAVINAANSDHASAAQALITGLEGTGKALLHTSGASVVGDDARGGHCSSQVFDGSAPLLVNPAKQARRDIDLQVLNAAQQGVRSVVICPSLIYGVGAGLNPHSVQLPFLVMNARQRGTVEIVGAGANVWSNVHINDVVRLYLLALTKAPAGAFYFAEIGAALALRLGMAGVTSLPAELAAQRWGEPRAYFSFGSNSRVRATRARAELGWSPVHASVQDWIARDMPV
jgi:nucleoside-diphosphate-sugar epimerase